MTKVCRMCLKDVNIDLFHDHATAKDGKMRVCIDCHKDRCGYSSHDPEHRARRLKNSQLMCSYGISIEQYEAMEKHQDMKCAICRNTQIDDRGLAVDYNHKTGEIRGLLCSCCNRALGGFKDDVTLLGKAIDHLKGRSLPLKTGECPVCLKIRDECPCDRGVEEL